MLVKVTISIEDGALVRANLVKAKKEDQNHVILLFC